MLHSRCGFTQPLLSTCYTPAPRGAKDCVIRQKAKAGPWPARSSPSIGDKDKQTDTVPLHSGTLSCRLCVPSS